MRRLNYQDLEFDHLVEFSNNTVFVAARESTSSHRCIFLINALDGCVYARNGRADSWEQLSGSDRDNILAHLAIARLNQTPIYRANGAYVSDPGGQRNLHLQLREVC